MEINEQMIVTLYKNYLNGNDISFALKIYKNKNFWIDLLEFFMKYQKTFPFRHIIENSIINDKLNKGLALNLLLNDFIDLFNSLDIEAPKELFKNLQNSYFRFILTIIILIQKENDKLENYNIITIALKDIDNYYEKDLNLLFNDFINYCIEIIKFNIINTNLKYAIKVFDFLSKIRENNKNDEFYLFIKPLLLSIESDEIKIKLDIDKYKNNKEIREDIILLLNYNVNVNSNKRFGDTEY